jgi:acetyl-CoA carboxylase biotin carboxyl carrier protein
MSNIKINSEVAGTVWKIEAQVGQTVGEEDVILIVESMKMEIPVTAPSKGKIVEIKVTEGEQISDQQLLVVMEG